MSEGRTIDLMGRMHRLSAEGWRRILYEGNVVAEFHAETTGRWQDETKDIGVSAMTSRERGQTSVRRTRPCTGRAFGRF
jgi:hypothetical protein